MTVQTVTLGLPEGLYERFLLVARATKRPLDELLVRAIQVGSPPTWEDAPADFQADLAGLDRLDDEALWRIARSRKTEAEMARYEVLLDKNAEGRLTAAERIELTGLRAEYDRLMLRKAYAVSLLRWRGHQIPPAEALSGAA